MSPAASITTKQSTKHNIMIENTADETGGLLAGAASSYGSRTTGDLEDATSEQPAPSRFASRLLLCAGLLLGAVAVASFGNFGGALPATLATLRGPTPEGIETEDYVNVMDDTFTDTELDGILQLQNYREPKARRQEIAAALGALHGRKHFWTLWKELIDYPIEPSVWTPTNGRPVLDRMHYVVVPIWWDGASQDPKWSMDKSLIRQGLEQVSEQYAAMSYRKHKLTFEIWDQSVLQGVTQQNVSWHRSAVATREYVASKGYVEFQNFTGIMLMHHPHGTNLGAGGRALKNGNFVWQSYGGANIVSTMQVGRHEIGHNYGHTHHKSNRYKIRLPGCTNCWDGWDMMSGGNGYGKSEFALASQWHYNWVTDDAVVTMQPEGPTEDCPDCLSSISGLVLKPFDDENVFPSASNKMGVHIPITGADKTVFSYWLSYRGSGNDGLANGGLSVHVSWFKSWGIFRAEYDSLNYDAYGDTDTTLNSFVIAGTCYVVSPSPRMMDVDIVAVEQVQPLVCVKQIRAPRSITISVDFLDASLASPWPPSPVHDFVKLDSHQTLRCSQDVQNNKLDVSGQKKHLLRYVGTGTKGMVNVTSFCLESPSGSGSAMAYFYDRYPYAPIALCMPPEYGAYRSLKVKGSPTCHQTASLDYLSVQGETYILIMGYAPEDSMVRLQSTCNATRCLVNQYMGSDGACEQCPADSFTGGEGTTSKEHCTSCAEFGGVLPIPNAGICVALPSNSSITTASGWRLFTDSTYLVEGWRWDLGSIEFFSSSKCSSSSKVDVSGGVAIDSSNAGSSYAAKNAFTSSGMWGGRPDGGGRFWIGMEFDKDVSVRCVKFTQWSGHASELYIQARQEGQSDAVVWSNVWLAKDLRKYDNTIIIG